MSNFKARKSDSKTGEVFLYDEIGGSIFGDGVSAKKFADEVNSLGKIDRLNLRMNSPGGDVFDGLAIFNFLKRHPADVVVDIDGMALSIASIIAMAGNKINMAKNAMMMIHDPWTVAVGSADDFREKADLMDKVKGNLVDTYVARSGLDSGKVSEMMNAETWFSADEALQNGMIDSVTEELQMAAKFDLSRFRHAPQVQAKTVGNNIYRAKLAAMSQRAKSYGASP